MPKFQKKPKHDYSLRHTQHTVAASDGGWLDIDTCLDNRCPGWPGTTIKVQDKRP